MREATKLHKTVLQSLEKLDIPGFDAMRIEKKGARLDLPNRLIEFGRKEVAQRKRSLCYTDAMLLQEHIPRVLIEVVDNNPTSPNGICGLTINVDRVAEFHSNIDLLYVVLSEMKEFYCSSCNCGHRFSNDKNQPCFAKQLGRNKDEITNISLIHEGKAAAYKKALVDYPIGEYLRNISPPTVLFLNANKVEQKWDKYQMPALNLVREEVVRIVASGRRTKARLAGIRELVPRWAASRHDIPLAN